ncbi:MAG TPA: hypothetical protein VFJ43_16075, partial [Bacteroidia bacterium]|nr:hypothetical protein [Bacteroidia bacterium]
APGKVVHKPFWKSGWFLGSMVAVAVAASAVVIYFGNQDSNQKPDTNPAVAQNVAKAQIDTNTNQNQNSNNVNTINSFATTKRKIVPPIEGLNVRSFSYRFNAAKGGTFTHNSGTKVTFPANAFVDANGNPVTGNVEIKYREFRDQADFFLSGIPMQYDSAGHTYQFESAGMMEISGSLDGKEVFLKKNQSVKIEFASKNSGTQFNLYKFDTLAGNWNYIGKDQVVLSPEQKNDSASLVAQALTTKGRLCGFIPEMQKPVEPVKPLHADKHKNRFTIAIDPLEFPEMKDYKDMIFEVDESNQKFNRNWYQDKTTWESIVLSKGKAENRYKIALKKSDQVVMLDVYPVFDGGNYDKAIADYDVKMDEYKKNLDQYNKMQEQRKAQEKGIFDNGNGEIVKVVDGGFMYYTKPATKDEKKSEDVMRTFTVSGFGVYNMDQIEQLPAGAIVSLTINDAGGKLFSGFATLYHVDKNKNSLFTYHNENPMTEFHFNPKSSNLIWAVKNGKLFYCDNADFAKLPHSGNTSLVLKEVTKEFKSPEEMKQFFHIGTSPQ